MTARAGLTGSCMSWHAPGSHPRLRFTVPIPFPRSVAGRRSLSRLLQITLSRNIRGWLRLRGVYYLLPIGSFLKAGMHHCIPFLPLRMFWCRTLYLQSGLLELWVLTVVNAHHPASTCTGCVHSSPVCICFGSRPAVLSVLGSSYPFIVEPQPSICVGSHA